MSDMKKQRIAVVPASYDPPTKGHMDIIERASRLFDKVIVVVAVNESKKAFLPVHTRVSMLMASCGELENVIVDSTSLLITDYMKSNGASVIVRGVRSGTDLDYEMNLEAIYKSQYTEAEVVVLTAKPEYSFISSSLIRTLYGLNGDYEKLVPESVYTHLSNPFTQKKVIYLCGNPGCGKTFFRTHNVAEFEAQNITFVFDANDFKDYSLLEHGYTQSDIHHKANKLAFIEAEKRIANAESMLCEVTAASMLTEVTKENVRKMRSLGYRVELYLFTDSLERSKARNSEREHPTPEDKYVDLSDIGVRNSLLNTGLFDLIKCISS